MSLKQITNFNTDKYIRDRPAGRVTAITLSHSNRIPSMSLGEESGNVIKDGTLSSTLNANKNY